MVVITVDAEQRAKSAIVRWMSATPAGPAEHFGVAHYGTDPKDLGRTAKSPLGWQGLRMAPYN